jgi:putative SOS response-associated peptidase YedK
MIPIISMLVHEQKLPVIKSYTNGKTIESLQWGLTYSWDKEKKIKP